MLIITIWFVIKQDMSGSKNWYHNMRDEQFIEIHMEQSIWQRVHEEWNYIPLHRVSTNIWSTFAHS